MEARLTEAETRISLAEDLVETLNLTVYRQQQQIDLLQRQFQHLHRQLQDGMAAVAAGERNPREEIPPHY
ncbi:MAG TPA: SlyX family protein [Accumulibacter sp.]|nr:SlyX family protein [Accumulibacter sp.]